MDIDKIGGLTRVVKPSGHEIKDKDNSFAEILDKTVDEASYEKRAGEVPSPLGEVSSVTRCETSPIDNSSILQCASKVLDLMDEYAQAMKNPQRTLKSVEPVVLRMQQELKGLESRSPDQDEDFGRLVDEIAVKASVEAFKFQRGDYI